MLLIGGFYRQRDIGEVRAKRAGGRAWFRPSESAALTTIENITSGALSASGLPLRFAKPKIAGVPTS